MKRLHQAVLPPRYLHPGDR